MNGNNTHSQPHSNHHHPHHPHHHSNHHSHRSHTVICRYFSQNGHCRWGDRCNYSHNLTSSTAHYHSGGGNRQHLHHNNNNIQHHNQQHSQHTSGSPSSQHSASSTKKKDSSTGSSPAKHQIPRSSVTTHHVNGVTPSSHSTSPQQENVLPPSSQSTSPSSASISFNSSPHVTLKPLCPSLNIIKSNFTRSSLNLLSTKPLLHIVVLYAGDINVRRYVAQLMPKFLHAKIHCFLQMNTPVSSENEDVVIENDLSMDEVQRMNCSIIKPEHLLQIITGSSADFLVVIGDRNMKHKTCQSKRNGKLIPAEIDEEVKRICDEWNQKKIKNPLDQIVASGISSAKKDDVLKVFQWITNVRHIKTRAKKLQSDIKELSDWYTSLGDSPETTLLMNQERLKELTKLQNVAIRLHREVHSAKQTTQNIPTDDEHSADQRDGLDLTFITDYLDNQIGVSHTLKEKLLEVSNAVLHKIEIMCKDFSVFPQEGPLWKAYNEEYLRDAKAHPDSNATVSQNFDRPQPKYWNTEHHAQRSRSSSNVSRSTVDTDHASLRTDKKSSAPIQIPPHTKNGSETPHQSAWQSSSASSSVIQPSSYSGAVISSLSSTPSSTHAELGDQSSIHTDDVSSILSSKSSSADPFQRESSMYNSSFMDAPMQHHGGSGLAPNLGSISNQMGNLNLYGGNSQQSGQLSSANTSSFSSPSGSPPIFDNTWQGGLSSGFGDKGQHSLLGGLNTSFGEPHHGGGSFLNQQRASSTNMWSSANGATSGGNGGSANVSRFADSSSASNSQAPGLFSDLNLVDSASGRTSRSSSNASGFLQTPFMNSSTSGTHTNAPSFQAPQLLVGQGSSQPTHHAGTSTNAPQSNQGGSRLMGNWSVPPFQSQQQQNSPSNARTSQWSDLRWNNANGNQQQQSGFTSPFSNGSS